MGCDIHMFVEYRKKNDKVPRWYSFGGRMNPGRNYSLFAALAGVRGEGGTPKGLPEDLGYLSNDENRFYITDQESLADRCVTLEKAKSWEKYGSKIIYHDGEPNWVTDPDNHSHSWATISELENAMKKSSEDNWECSDEYYALVAAMKELEKRGNDVRVVYWFDN